MPMVLAVLASVITIPLLLMIATCLLERVESSLVPHAERVVRATSIPSSGEAPARHLALVRDGGVDDVVDPQFDPDATAQLRWVS